MRFAPSILALILASALPGQVGAGTLCQSMNPLQLPGVSTIGVPGNPSITPNEITAWADTEPGGLMRSLFNAQQLGILLGDMSGNGAPFDWPDIDAFHVDPPLTGSGRTQPDVFAARFSVSSNIVNGGQVVATPGDVIRFSGVGSFTTVLSRAQLQSAIGTTAALDVKGYSLLPDGSALVSFGAFGAGNNIIHPNNGSLGSSIPFGPADVFIIRPPYGSQPALFAYRQTELAVIVNFFYGGWPNPTVAGIDSQKLFAGTAPPLNNPNDPLNAYQGGTRPYLLWTIGGDDNVFCWNANLNPLAPGMHNFYAIVGSGNASVGGYVTNVASNRVIADALCVVPMSMGLDSRLTLDTSNLAPPPGTNIQLSVRGPGGALAASRMYQVAVSTTLATGTGAPLIPTGLGRVLLDVTDPIFAWSLNPVIAPMLQTAGSNPQGTATTINLGVPASIPTGTLLHFQAVEMATASPLTTALTVIVN